MHSPFLFSALPYLVLSIALALTTDGPILSSNVSAFINQLLTEYGSPGGIGVAVVGKTAGRTWNIETKGYGVTTLVDGSSVTENTLFAISSNSKVIPGCV